MHTSDEIKFLKEKAITIRENIVKMIPPGKVGHLGGSSSIAEIIAALYFSRVKNFCAKDFKNPNRDRVVLSKGHTVLAQYAAFAEMGFFSEEELKKVKTLNGMLQGHPDIDKTPGLEAVTGSLGQGLSICNGIALALKLNKSTAKVFCICGDGELGEGQIWEAGMTSVNYKLDNICCIIDKNGVQATGPTSEIFPIDDIEGKFKSFGWNVIEIDGHDMNSILEALDKADEVKGRPTAIVAKTIKGKGFAFAEGKAQFHNASLNEEQYKECLESIKEMRRQLNA